MSTLKLSLKGNSVDDKSLKTKSKKLVGKKTDFESTPNHVDKNIAIKFDVPLSYKEAKLLAEQKAALEAKLAAEPQPEPEPVVQEPIYPDLQQHRYVNEVTNLMYSRYRNAVKKLSKSNLEQDKREQYLATVQELQILLPEAAKLGQDVQSGFEAKLQETKENHKLEIASSLAKEREALDLTLVNSAKLISALFKVISSSQPSTEYNTFVGLVGDHFASHSLENPSTQVNILKYLGGSLDHQQEDLSNLSTQLFDLTSKVLVQVIDPIPSEDIQPTIEVLSKGANEKVQPSIVGIKTGNFDNQKLLKLFPFNLDIDKLVETPEPEKVDDDKNDCPDLGIMVSVRVPQGGINFFHPSDVNAKTNGTIVSSEPTPPSAPDSVSMPEPAVVLAPPQQQMLQPEPGHYPMPNGPHPHQQPGFQPGPGYPKNFHPLPGPPPAPMDPNFPGYHISGPYQTPPPHMMGPAMTTGPYLPPPPHMIPPNVTTGPYLPPPPHMMSQGMPTPDYHFPGNPSPPFMPYPPMYMGEYGMYPPPHGFHGDHPYPNSAPYPHPSRPVKVEIKPAPPKSANKKNNKNNKSSPTSSTQEPSSPVSSQKEPLSSKPSNESIKKPLEPTVETSKSKPPVIKKYEPSTENWADSEPETLDNSQHEPSPQPSPQPPTYQANEQGRKVAHSNNNYRPKPDQELRPPYQYNRVWNANQPPPQQGTQQGYRKTQNFNRSNSLGYRGGYKNNNNYSNNRRGNGSDVGQAPYSPNNQSDFQP